MITPAMPLVAARVTVATVTSRREMRGAAVLVTACGKKTKTLASGRKRNSSGRDSSLEEEEEESIGEEKVAGGNNSRSCKRKKMERRCR